jgi:dTDP-glucose 4,6-dehydratase
MMKRLLVTGGAGFIGSNFIHHMLSAHPDCRITNLDKLTYAGNLDNLKAVEGNPNYRFVHGDICDPKLAADLVKEADWVVNFAAESHVDRSVDDPYVFTRTNIIGTHVMLEESRRAGVKLFLQIGTDEVYGSVEQGSSVEGDRLEPRSPYSASKAAADLLALSYFATFGMDVRVTRCTNNYGPYQFPEKLIPFFVTNALEDRELPIYGDGLNVRDWLYVADHCQAIDFILENGAPGEVYNIGGGQEMTNIQITDIILSELGKPQSLKKFVKDRPGHDRRYSLDISKIRQMGWSPKYSFEQAVRETIRWYLEHQDWWRKIKEGKREHQEFQKRWYQERK